MKGKKGKASRERRIKQKGMSFSNTDPNEKHKLKPSKAFLAGTHSFC